MTQKQVAIILEARYEGEDESKQLIKDLKEVDDSAKASSDGVDKAGKSIGFLEDNLGKLVTGGALLLIARQLLEFGQQALQAASDAEESMAKFDVVFAQTARSVERDLSTIADATGRSKYELIDYAATLQDTFVPLGFAREEAAAMSTQLTQLAIDLGSFNNLETAEVVRDLQSALVGNTETLRKYGVVASQAAIEQEAINSGLWDGTGAIDAQAKAQAILNLTLNGTTDAQGDAERTADSYANVTRELDAAIQDLSVTMGQKAQPAMTQAKRDAIDLVRELQAEIVVWDMLDQALREGTITQEEYNQKRRQVYTSLFGAKEVVEELTAREQERLQLLEYQSEQWRKAGQAQWDYYRGLLDISEEAEELPGPPEQHIGIYERLAEEAYTYSNATGEVTAKIELATAAAAAWEAQTAAYSTAAGDYFTAVADSAEPTFDVARAMYDAADAAGAGIGPLADYATQYGIFTEEAIAAAKEAAQVQTIIDIVTQAVKDGRISWDEYDDAVMTAVDQLKQAESPEMELKPTVDTSELPKDAQKLLDLTEDDLVVPLSVKQEVIQESVDTARGIIEGFTKPEEVYQAVMEMDITDVEIKAGEATEFINGIPTEKTVTIHFTSTGYDELIDKMNEAGVAP